MTVNKRKKNSRHRGSWTHGYGEKKKHRGAGSRGGRGMAGTGKRADTKKPSIAADKLYFGKHGFKKKNRSVNETITLSALQQRIDTLGKKQGAVYVVDLTASKYDKVLGSGKVVYAMKITVAKASASAVEKVKTANGEIIIA